MSFVPAQEIDVAAQDFVSEPSFETVDRAHRPAEPAAIVCKGLRKVYGRGSAGLVALDGVDLQVPRHECFGLLGPNGAGKSTLVHVLEGLLAATSGEVSLLGGRWSTDAARLRRRIGVSLQDTRLPDRLTALECVELFASFYEDALEPAALLGSVSLHHKSTSYVRDLSGGQRQRLAFACAIVGKPELLFLDEPTVSLDPNARREVWELIWGFMKQGGTVLLTTHSMEEAERLCDRVAVIDRGRIIADGSPLELTRQFGGDHIIDFSVCGAAPPVAAEFARLPHVTRCVTTDESALWRIMSTKPQATLTALFELLRTADCALDKIAIRQATLDDVFVALTGKRLEA